MRGSKGFKVVGRIAEYNGNGKAVVRANGTLHEVDVRLLRIIPSCAHCGKAFQTKDQRAKYCSRACYLAAKACPVCVHCGQRTRYSRAQYCSQRCSDAAQMAQTDREVFAALVAYKRAHDGISPRLTRLAKDALMHQQTVSAALKRLEQAGRIWIEGEPPYQVYGVVGGKWTYEP
jgi:hypothetical protein